MKPHHGILLILVALVCMLLLQKVTVLSWQGEASPPILKSEQRSALVSTKSTRSSLPKEVEILEVDQTLTLESPAPRPAPVPDPQPQEQAASNKLGSTSLRTDSPFYFIRSSELGLSPEERLQLPEMLASSLPILFENQETQPLVFDADALSTTQAPMLIYGKEDFNLTGYLHRTLLQERAMASSARED